MKSNGEDTGQRTDVHADAARGGAFACVALDEVVCTRCGWVSSADVAVERCGRCRRRMRVVAEPVSLATVPAGAVAMLVGVIAMSSLAIAAMFVVFAAGLDRREDRSSTAQSQAMGLVYQYARLLNARAEAVGEGGYDAASPAWRVSAPAVLAAREAVHPYRRAVTPNSLATAALALDSEQTLLAFVGVGASGLVGVLAAWTWLAHRAGRRTRPCGYVRRGTVPVLLLACVTAVFVAAMSVVVTGELVFRAWDYTWTQ